MRLVNLLRAALHVLGLVLILLAVLGPLTSKPGDLSLQVTLACGNGSTGPQQCTASSPNLVSRTSTTLADLAVPLTGAGLALELVAIGLIPAVWSPGRGRSEPIARQREQLVDQLDLPEQIVPVQPPGLGRKETPAKQAGRWFTG